MLKRKQDLKDWFTTGLRNNAEFGSLENANTEHKNSLVYCDSIAYLLVANQNPNVACIITTDNLQQHVNQEKGLILSENPRAGFYELYIKLLKEEHFISIEKYTCGSDTVIHPTSIISKKCTIGNNCSIGAGASIGDNVKIGDNVTLEAGAVVGTNGILYYKKNDLNKIVPHAGGVFIEDNVTILSNAVIVSSVSSNFYTRIGKGTIVGISSTIGHEAQISSNCIISGNCVIARRAELHDNVYIGSSCVIREYVQMQANSKALAGSIVVKNVEESRSVSGNFAFDHRKHLRGFSRLTR